MQVVAEGRVALTCQHVGQVRRQSDSLTIGIRIGCSGGCTAIIYERKNEERLEKRIMQNLLSTIGEGNTY